MTVSAAIVLAVVRLIVADFPQSKVMTPPFWIAASSFASVQVPSPVPTTVVGFETSAAFAGGLQVFATGGGFGFPRLRSRSS